MSVVAIYALVWSVYAVLIFGAFRSSAPRSPGPSFACGIRLLASRA